MHNLKTRLSEIRHSYRHKAGRSQRRLARLLRKLMGSAFIVGYAANAHAGAITFNLRDNTALEPLDGGVSLQLTQAPATLTVTAGVGVLNVTSSGFGVDIPGTSCNRKDDADALDAGCAGVGFAAESLRLQLSTGISMAALLLSKLSGTDQGILSVANVEGVWWQQVVSRSGLVMLPDLPLGSWLTVAFDPSASGNGFSVDALSGSVLPAGPPPNPDPGPGADPVVVAAPGIWSTAAAGLLALLATRRRRLPLILGRKQPDQDATSQQSDPAQPGAAQPET